MRSIRLRILVTGALGISSLVFAAHNSNGGGQGGIRVHHRRHLTVAPTTSAPPVAPVTTSVPRTTVATAATTIPTTSSAVPTTGPASPTTKASAAPTTAAAPTTKATATPTTVATPPGDCSARPVLVAGVFKEISPPGVALVGSPPYGVTDVQFAPSDPCVLYSTIDMAGMWKSVNGGASWSRIGTLDSPTGIVVDPRDANHLYASQGVRGNTQGFWVSRDGGVSWRKPAGFAAGEGLWSADVYSVAVDPADFNHVLLTFHTFQWSNNNNGDTGVIESFDGGESWTPHFQAGWGHGLTAMFLDASNRWLLGTQEHGMWRTMDGGVSWAKVDENPMAHGGTQLYRSVTGVLYMGSWNGILRSTDNGASWITLGSANGVGYCPHYSAVGDGKNLYTSCAYTGTNGTSTSYPYSTSPEADGLNWTVYNGGGQTFINGPGQQVFDKANRIMYSANGSAGILALKIKG